MYLQKTENQVKKTLLFLFFSHILLAQNWSIPFAQRTALINLYNATSGQTWSQNWDFNKDPKTWFGVKIKNGNVVELNLRGNALKGNFPSTLSPLVKLQKLDLSNNQLQGDVSPTISSFSNLVRLDISNNRLTGDPTTMILPLSNLTEISIGNNDFQFADLNVLLGNFPNLQVLDISKMGLTAVPQKVSSLTKLTALNLSNNAISQGFSNVASLNNLTEINISGNQLTKIPAELSTLIGLKMLDASNNAFSANYSATLSSLKNLEWLSLKSNQITTFPAELLQLKKLIHLNFSDNKIPSGLGALAALPELEQIFLDKNLISGSFPTELLQLKKLQMISLIGNQLSGEIPEEIPQLTFLENNRYTTQQIRNFFLINTPKADFTYSPQRYDEEKTMKIELNHSANLTQSLSGTDYQFTWFKNLDQKTPVISENYFINNVAESDYVAYTCEAYYFENLPEQLLEISFYREPITLIKELGTEEINRDLVVYPNPTSDYLHIKTTKIDIEKIFIFDLSGKLLSTENQRRIDVRHLPSGTYVISIKTSEGIKSFKFIKI